MWCFDSNRNAGDDCGSHCGFVAIPTAHLRTRPRDPRTCSVSSTRSYRWCIVGGSWDCIGAASAWMQGAMTFMLCQRIDTTESRCASPSATTSAKQLGAASSPSQTSSRSSKPLPTSARCCTVGVVTSIVTIHLCRLTLASHRPGAASMMQLQPSSPRTHPAACSSPHGTQCGGALTHPPAACTSPLNRVLHAALPPDTVTRTRVVDLRTDADGRVTLTHTPAEQGTVAGTETWTADLVVGADGSGSMVRSLVAPHAGAYAGYVGWRGWLAEDEAPAAARAAIGDCFAVCKVHDVFDSSPP